jgi:hypothetical protein
LFDRSWRALAGRTPQWRCDQAITCRRTCGCKALVRRIPPPTGRFSAARAGI